MIKKHFSGKIVRVEKDGFGMVDFDKKIGKAGQGYFNANTVNVGPLYKDLRPGTVIKGIVSLTEGDVLQVIDLDLVNSEITAQNG